MKQVAKLALTGPSNSYLLLYRDAHPTFGDNPDLPGGTVEDGESLLEGLVREVYEETTIVIDSTNVKLIYEGSEYSHHDTRYSLFAASISDKPAIELSWEHARYEWVSLDVFLDSAKHARDTYMHMVHDTLR